MKKLLVTLIVTGLLVGCGTVFTSVITVTDVVDSAMKSWAYASVHQQTTPDFDARVIGLHDKYRQSVNVAQAAFKLYKTSDDAADLETALKTARDGALPLVELIAGILSPSKATQLKQNILKASKP